MISTVVFVGARNTATISSLKSGKEWLTVIRSSVFSTKRRGSYDKLISKQHSKSLTTNENQRIAFINLKAHPQNIKALPTPVHTDSIGIMISDRKNPNQIVPPTLFTAFCSKQSAVPTITRLYHSSPQRNFLNNNKNNKNNDDNEKSGIVRQAKNIAKKFLPSTWFQSDEERRQLAEQKQMQKDIQTGIQQMFKDAPLPIRMVSNIIGPIFGSMMSSLAETAASQQSLMDIVIDQADRAIRNDPVVQGLLGDSITVGRPFSQSSSSSSINGVASTRIELAFPVSGRLGNGVGRLSASGGADNPIIDRLVIQANGREVDVSVGTASSFNQRMKSDQPNNPYVRDKSNIIDAEIIEKDTKK